MAMMGRMMSSPLLISSLLMHAERHSGDVEIVSMRVEGDLHRSTWREVARRSCQAAQAFARLGCERGDRVGTLAWNGHRHLEIYYGASGSELVCHTINPRLFPEQIAWIVNDAEDRVLCFDATFLPLVEKIAPLLKSVQHFVLMTSRVHMPASTGLPHLLCFDELLEAEDGAYTWPEFDELTASSICYTSGTTGHPKGAVYTHRSTVLHAYASALPDAMDCSGRDVILPVVPMFHVNAWGLPYGAAMTGAKLVFPGAALDGKSVYELIESERVTMAAGVPTVWLGLLNHMAQHGLKFSTMKRTVIGGSACPPAMIKTFRDDYGVTVVHAWGMTEMSPLGTVNTPKLHQQALPAEQQLGIMAKQGRAVYGVEMRIVDPDGHDLPWDGQHSGDLLVKGPWIISSYFKGEGGDPLQGGWFPTGDVASIDPDGFLQITDRSKDVIKSGGEWISSIDVENIAMSHPAVAMAACIAVPHPKWDERPLLVVMKKPGEAFATATAADILAHFEGRIAKWQVPDDVVFVDSIPLGATGKMQKNKLRDQFKGHVLPGA